MEVQQHLPREGMLRARRQLYALTVFGVLVLLVMAAFSWLLYRSLAAREVRGLLAEVELEADRMAVFIEQEVAKDPKKGLLLQLTAGTIRPVLDAVLIDRRGVAEVEVLDEMGATIFSGGRVGDAKFDRPSYTNGPPPGMQIEVPIGELGRLVVNLDPQEQQRVVEAVRAAVIGRASSMLAFVLALFGVAAAAVWRNYAASREEVERAAHTERMAYIGTLAAGLAHEIRSPLNSLSLNMQMLDEEIAKIDPEGSGRRLLEITSAEIERLGNLVTEFLNYARPRPMKLEEQVARDLVDRVVAVVGPALEARGLEVKVEDLGSGARVLVDPDQIHQMLLNLTQNAAQATERLRRPAWIEYVIDREEDWVRIKIHDNGRGMPEEHLAQATEIFYSRRKGGTGLGLAIVERIIKSHNGRLNIESELQVGTTVTVELPAVS